MGFGQIGSHPCIYVSTDGEMFVNAVRVGDIVLATKSDKRMGEPYHYLGGKMIQNLGL